MLVFFRLHHGEIPIAGLIVGGALAAVAGRFLLARAFRGFGRKLAIKRTESFEVLGRALDESRGGLVSSFVFFAVAPVPSAQMFDAAGLSRIRLAPLLSAFFVGRSSSPRSRQVRPRLRPAVTPT